MSRKSPKKLDLPPGIAICSYCGFKQTWKAHWKRKSFECCNCGRRDTNGVILMPILPARPMKDKARSGSGTSKKKQSIPSQARPKTAPKKVASNPQRLDPSTSITKEAPSVPESNSKSEGPKTVEIGGQVLSIELMNIRHLCMFRDTIGNWVLSTTNGQTVASFESGEDLYAWLNLFQREQGRGPLSVKRTDSRPKKCKRINKQAQRKPPSESCRDNTSPSNSKSTGTEYLKPWNDVYEMPDYDLE